MLTACGREEYICEYGFCISKDKNCDMITDCRDQTDELNCDIIIVPPGYSQALPPPRRKSEPLLMLFFLIITSVKTFDLSAFTIATDVIWHSKWIDSRLIYSNLLEEYRANRVKNLQKIWTPAVHITDGTQGLVDGADEAARVIYVLRMAPSIADDDERIAEGKDH